MALIGEIRKRSGLLLLIIGGALLLFVLSDAFGNKGNGPQSNSIGSVAGQEIDNITFGTEVQRRVDNLTIYRGPNPQYDQAIRDQLWTYMTEDIVLGNTFDALGFTVPQAEYADMIGGSANNPASELRQSFQDQQTGQIYLDSMLNYVAFMETEKRAQPFWGDQVRDMMRNRRYEKFYTIMGKGMYMTSLEATDRFHAQNDIANFNFVTKKYTSIPDSLVSFTEEDLKAYYEAHKTEAIFEQKASRDVRYLEWQVAPSDADKQDLIDKMTAMKTDFAAAKSDSLHVMQKSDVKFYSKAVYTMGGATPLVDSLMVNADTMDIVGPYLVNNDAMMRISKILNPNDADTLIKASHILLKVEDGDTTAAIAKLKGLRKEVQGGADFAELAKANSEGPSAPQGGDLGPAFGRGAMVGPFEKACFEGQPGDMPIVKTQFGAHLINIQEKVINKKITMVNIDKQLRASKETEEKMYEGADFYVASYFQADSLIAAAEANGLTVGRADRVVKNTVALPGVAGSEGVLDWAFDKTTKPNDVSRIFELDGLLVIAMVTRIYEDGIQDFEDVKGAVQALVIKEKKAEKYIALMDPKQGLAAIATAIGETVLPANNIKFNQFTIPGGGGNEPAVIGELWSLAPQEVSRAMKGETGVYVVQMQNKVPVEPQPGDIASLRKTLSQNNAGIARTTILKSLMDAANITDSRRRQ